MLKAVVPVNQQEVQTEQIIMYFHDLNSNFNENKQTTFAYRYLYFSNQPNKFIEISKSFYFIVNIKIGPLLGVLILLNISRYPG